MTRNFWLIISLIASSVLNGCSSTKKEPAKDQPKETPIVSGQLHTVANENIPWIVRTQGSLVSDEVASIGAKVPGRVIQTLVDLGDHVQAEMPLVKLDSAEYQLMVNQAEAQLTQARSAVGLKPGDPLEALNPDNAPPVREARAIWNEARQAIARIRNLAEKDAISATDLEVAESAERVAEAKLASAQNSVREKIAMISVAQAQLGLAKERFLETTIFAPFDGIVQSRVVGEGSFVQTGQSLLTIVRVDKLRFRSSIPERYAQHLQLNQRVTLILEQGIAPREVSITRISPTIDLQSRSLLYEAVVDNADESLRTGLFAEADIVLDAEAREIAVPIAAVVRFAGVDKVWKWKDGMIIDQPIQLGRKVGSLVQVLSGLGIGDQILADGSNGRAGKYQSSSPSQQDS